MCVECCHGLWQGSCVEALATCRTNGKDLSSWETTDGSPNMDVSAAPVYLFPLIPTSGETLQALALPSEDPSVFSAVVVQGSSVPMSCVCLFIDRRKAWLNCPLRRIIPWILGCNWWASGQRLFLSGFSTGSVCHSACSSPGAPRDCAEARPRVAALPRGAGSMPASWLQPCGSPHEPVQGGEGQLT